ncbi:DNA glycosylase [Corynespora cassiicola Philippines]|uniref:Adenine DNA glycosylase n=1 Tax=Corynespora cassiicola Philippines TaxID=1448308 RepID=A0A2T2P109_CORCC|nr:DNA glycosylase [Corynespora cassiicola Philippines]
MTRKRPSSSTTVSRAPKKKKQDAFTIPRPSSPVAPAVPPSRAHPISYHHPLLLEYQSSCNDLLAWFESVEETRNMPWRKEWIDPETFAGKEKELGAVLAKRAYEVWVSEVMLQQTRVSTVIPYFKNWISKWPTVQDLADASHDDVLNVWKGLGYYSRATRLHQGAQAFVARKSESCPIPSSAEELQEFPGIGKYTAGAISSIAFGEAEPVLDGNVARVLSRQLGLYVDAKDKKSTDLLWIVADQLIKEVANYPETMKSDVPGKWNQALMELGSTICTPRPKCDECPIQKTCRVYTEGQALSNKTKRASSIPDIEDACTLCEQLDTEDLAAPPEGDNEDEESSATATKKKKVQAKKNNTISNYFTAATPRAGVTADSGENVGDTQTPGSKKRKSPAAEDLKAITTYCSLFPKKVAKKKVAEEDCVVCIVEVQMPTQSKWLIEQRPAKGLLGSLWQFPQEAFPASKNTPSYRKASAQKFISTLQTGQIDMSKAKFVAELDSLVHVFSHLKLTMHVSLFKLELTDDASPDMAPAGVPARKWVDTDAMGDQTLSTGMRRCWELVQKRLS